MGTTENKQLRAARERTASLRHVGECLSRRELAELVNVFLWQRHELRAALDDNYIAKLERGTILWPNAKYREAFRAVLQVDTDTNLGFVNSRRQAAPLDSDPARGGHTATPGGRCGANQASLPPDASVPQQLPAPPLRFTARADELRALSAVCDEAKVAGEAVMVMSAVAGVGGVGKTSLALHWAHRELDRFPDGQLYVDLRGFDPANPPLPPAAAVRGFLDALGVTPSAIPESVSAQIALYRTLVSGKRMLIVLDNARDTAAVEALLPGSATNTVIVTSRNHLPGLAARGAHALRLRMFTPAEARELFAEHLGADKMDTDADASADLVRFCAGLPLAISIIAARASENPTFPLALLADELTDETHRLDGLDAGEVSVHLSSVFAASYRSLDTDAADLFRHLGLTSGADIGTPAVASLVGKLPRLVRRQLRTVQNSHLLEQHRPDRYRMHDLVSLYARDRAHSDLPAESQEQAIRRLVDFYLHTAFKAERLLDARRPSIDLPPASPGSHAYTPPDHAAAERWLIEEHTNLLAAQQLAIRYSWHDKVWRLAWTLNTYHVRHDRRDDNLRSWQAAIDVVAHIPGVSDQAEVHRLCGWAHMMVGEHELGMHHLERALSLFQDADDLAGQARAYEALAAAWEQHGDHQRALPPALQALDLYQNLNQPARTANALNTVGWHYARLGELDRASTFCTAALNLYLCHRYHDAEAYALHTLGYIDHHSGRYHDAVRHYRRAVSLLRAERDPKQEAVVLADLAEVHASGGNRRRARQLWIEALALHRQQHRTSDIERIKRRLAELD
ncbi:tetratricopeptide repeat protein [Amycolatopsis sp. NPDC051045]|uniref:ATP-binding protein n=1 Tax=Amycolatopsis sp. NPDC051045 TaxID=3156922 RepID=UPI0034397E04